jgi:hypothetical protein
MGKARRRELWDMTAALELTIMSSGLSRPKRMPKLNELNPVRVADGENDDSDDIFEMGNKMFEKAKLRG